MAEGLTEKRPRDEPLQSAASQSDAGEAAKRQKPYEEILSLLDVDEEDEPHKDVSYLITTLQQELSSPSSTGPPSPSRSPAGDGGSKESDREDERERVMRHLLEASDDELGLPSRSDGSADSGAEVLEGADPQELLADLCDGGLWQLEDEAANYYALLQSELFRM